MALCRKNVNLDWRIASLVISLALVLSACERPITPTAAVEPTPTPVPTSTPAPIHDPLFTISPDIEEILAGEDVSITLSFDPPVAVKEVKWQTNDGVGKIEPDEGSNVVIFTAPMEKRHVIVGVTGTTVDGASFDEKFTFSVVLPPTPTPLPLCPFASDPIAPPKFTPSTLEGTIISPARCENNLPVGTAFPVSGTAGNIPENAYLWLLALAQRSLLPTV